MATLWLILMLCLGSLPAYVASGQGAQAMLPLVPFLSSLEAQALTAKQQGAADPLALLLVADARMTASEYAQAKTALAGYLKELKAEQATYTRAKPFLRKVFRLNHQRFLKEFVAYTPFSQLVTRGKYNCVSATALFALLLEGLGYRYQIYETPFHLYLRAEDRPGNTILLESTDPVYGFVTGRQAIASREIRYSQPDSTSWCAKAALCPFPKADCPTRFLRPISLTELCGLQYANQAISHYNRLELEQARSWLQKAAVLYPNAPRINGLKAYIEQEEARAKNLSFKQYQP